MHRRCHLARGYVILVVLTALATGLLAAGGVEAAEVDGQESQPPPLLPPYFAGGEAMNSPYFAGGEAMNSPYYAGGEGKDGHGQANPPLIPPGNRGGEIDGVENPSSLQVWKPSPTGAALRSLAIPGWGQLHNQAPLKAVIYGGLEEALIYGIYRQHRMFRFYRAAGDDTEARNYREDRNRLAWYLTATVLLSVMDAYVDAHLFGFDVSREPGEPEPERGFLGSGIVVRVGLGLIE